MAHTSSSTGSEYRHDHDAVAEQCATSIHASISTLLWNEKFSDMTILCNGREFKVHRAIVCTQSVFFDRALNSNFKEAASGVVDLPDDDPDVLECFLEFLYTGAYSDGVNNTWGKPSAAAKMNPQEVQESLNTLPGPAQFLARPVEEEDDNLFKASKVKEDEVDEEYEEDDDADEELPDADGPVELSQEMEELSMEAVSMLENGEGLRRLAEMRDDMTLPLCLYVIADKYDVPALRLLARERFYRAAELVWEQADDFPDIVDEIYLCTRETDQAMREIVCRLVGTRIQSDRVRQKMRVVMEKYGEFAVGVMEYSLHLGYPQLGVEAS
ncbi:hypothetical protein FDECE_3227 [Fusarium decemcellulare]|nr:hypothetical protein FDECE_3227 [Fusarium decemcellulare]